MSADTFPIPLALDLTNAAGRPSAGPPRAPGRLRALAGRAGLAADVLRAQGAGWAFARGLYEVRRRSGLLKRSLPQTSWDDFSLDKALRDPSLAEPGAYLAYRRAQAPPFLFGPGFRDHAALLRGWDEGREGPSKRASALARGVVRYFGHADLAAGDPPRWHANPWTGRELPGDRHFGDLGDFAHGDIKAVWEPGRFAFAFDLVRAYARDGDDAHAERFWRLVDDWRGHNPPYLGPHWKCGQEASLRLLALAFGLYGFLHSPATTPERVDGLARVAAATGRRVEATLGYALSQRNNHGVSEGVGLWTVGALFPELKGAARWADLGRKVLEDLGRTLVYDDGAFSQHSVNYHRVMLHDYLWAVRLGDAVGRPFSPALRGRLAKSADLLYQLQDEATGRLPNYGHHDGALVLPLDNGDARDYRSALQAAHYLTDGTRLYPDGPWDEALFWLFGPEAVRAPVDSRARVDLRAGEGGYHTLRGAGGFAFVHCGPFKDRPSQSDLLHVDLWWRGQNVAIDAGTYSYNAPAPWDVGLSSAACHNTVTVDGVDPMRRAGKFLWVPRVEGVDAGRRVSKRGGLACWEGWHDGYARRLGSFVRHRRALLRVGGEHWVVVDDLDARGPHRYRLHWLLNDWPHARSFRPDSAGGGDGGAFASVALDTPAGPYAVRLGTFQGRAEASVVRADPEGPRGWHSPAYLKREPALSVALTRDARSARFWTVFGPSGYAATTTDVGLDLVGPSWAARVGLSPAGSGGPVVATARLDDDELPAAKSEAHS